MVQARYYLLSAGSGLTWSGIAYLLLREWFPGLWVGIAVSPLFGLLVGFVHRPTYRLPVVVRVFVAFVTLYAAAALFGYSTSSHNETTTATKSLLTLTW